MLDTFSASAIESNEGGADAEAPLSFLAATLDPTGPGTFEISYPAAADRQFSVEVWNPITELRDELLSAQTGSGTSDARTINTGDPDHFYRVRAELP